MRQHLVRQESAVLTYIRTHLASCLVEISKIIKGTEHELLTAVNTSTTSDLNDQHPRAHMTHTLRLQQGRAWESALPAVRMIGTR